MGPIPSVSPDALWLQSTQNDDAWPPSSSWSTHAMYHLYTINTIINRLHNGVVSLWDYFPWKKSIISTKRYRVQNDLLKTVSKQETCFTSHWTWKTQNTNQCLQNRLEVLSTVLDHISRDMLRVLAMMLPVAFSVFTFSTCMLLGLFQDMN